MLTAALILDELDGRILTIKVAHSSGGPGQDYRVAGEEGAFGLLLVPDGGHVISKPLPIASSYDLGEPVAVIGYPTNALAAPGLTITTGTLASAVQLAAGTWVLLIDARVYRGNSGGPVLSADGSVIGFIDSVGLVDEFGCADPFTYVMDITGREFPK